MPDSPPTIVYLRGRGGFGKWVESCLHAHVHTYCVCTAVDASFRLHRNVSPTLRNQGGHALRDVRRGQREVRGEEEVIGY